MMKIMMAMNQKEPPKATIIAVLVCGVEQVVVRLRYISYCMNIRRGFVPTLKRKVLSACNWSCIWFGKLDRIE